MSLVFNRLKTRLVSYYYSHLSNKRGAWNKRGGGTENGKSLNVELEINVEGVQKMENQ